MQQYFTSYVIEEQQLVTFDQKQTHHMLRVMRFVSGTKVLVVDRQHQKYQISLTVDGSQVIGHVEHRIEQTTELPIQVIVAQGLIKGERFDLFLQKASELGVHRIIPLSTRRSVVKIEKDKEDKKRQRWQAIAREAAEQARRNVVPLVDEVMNLKDLMNIEADVKLVAFEEDNQNSTAFKQSVQSMQANQSILLVIGSEGGLAQEEVDELCRHDFIRCGLGPRILRAETAAMYALSAISYEWELTTCSD